MIKNKSYKWIEKKQEGGKLRGPANNKSGYYVHRGSGAGRVQAGLTTPQMYSQQTQPQKVITLKPFNQNKPFNNHANNQHSHNQQYPQHNNINHVNNRLNNIYGPSTGFLHATPVYNDNYNVRKTFNNYSSDSESSDTDDILLFNNNYIHKQNKDKYKNKDIPRPSNYVIGGNIALKQNKYKNKDHGNNDKKRASSFCDRESCQVCAKVKKVYHLPPPPKSVSYNSASDYSNYSSSYRDIKPMNAQKNNLQKIKEEYKKTVRKPVAESDDTYLSKDEYSLDSKSSYSYSGSTETCDCTKCQKRAIEEAKLKQKIMKKFGNKKINLRLNASESTKTDIKCDDIKCANCYGY
jgi:hypothetical protein